jgi:hypothetical protein
MGSAPWSTDGRRDGDGVVTDAVAITTDVNIRLKLDRYTDMKVVER